MNQYKRKEYTMPTLVEELKKVEENKKKQKSLKKPSTNLLRNQMSMTHLEKELQTESLPK
jgi:hypothetical protein